MSFNTKILKISLGLISFSLSSFAIANVPSPKQIKDNILNKYQSSANPQGAIKVSNTKQIRLLNGEIAYISSADYADSARNFWGGYILTRPKFKYSVILQKFGGQSNTYKLHPIKYNGRMIDLVEFENSSSGQGWSGTTKTLTYINGWTVHDLDKIEEDPGHAEYQGDKELPTLLGTKLTTSVITVKDAYGNIIQLGSETKMKF